MERTYRLVVSCPDRTGIVAKVSNFLTTYNGWITEASYHADQKKMVGFLCVMKSKQVRYRLI
jgi:formyltetrahydrofolate hydrolase